MAGPYHGKTGRVSHNGTVLTSLSSWEFSTSIDVLDTTPMGAVNDWETQETGLSDFSGTAEGISSKSLDTVALLGDNGNVKFHFSNGGDDGEFEGNAIITSLTETVGVDDVGKLSYSFEGNDPLGLTFTSGAASANAIIATAFPGKHVRVLWNENPMYKPKNWSCTMNVSTADSTAAAGTNNSRTRIAGFKNATATFTVLISDSGFADSASNTIALGDSQTLQLWRTNSIADGAYSGTATITDISMSNPKDGVVEATYSAKFNGELSFVTS